MPLPAMYAVSLSARFAIFALGLDTPMGAYEFPGQAALLAYLIAWLGGGGKGQVEGSKEQTGSPDHVVCWWYVIKGAADLRGRGT